jgi:catechol 2,3-dioxygenase-like lactoylglutathione lyase family enzyme
MQVSAPFEPAISVRNLDRMLAFYRDLLGMSVFSIDVIGPEQSAAASLARAGYRIARLDTEGGDRLKLVAPLEKPAEQDGASLVLARHGFAYLTFIVPSVREVLNRLVDGGATIVTGTKPVAFRPGVVDLVFAQDPEGNFLEFVERNDLAVYRNGA